MDIYECDGSVMHYGWLDILILILLSILLLPVLVIMALYYALRYR